MGRWHAAKRHPGDDEYRHDWTVYDGDIEVATECSAFAAEQMVRHNNHVADLQAENARLLRWMARTHSTLAEHGETALEVWTMRRLEAAMQGQDADDWRERIGEVE